MAIDATLKALGIELIVNLDTKWPGMRFTRKFWEQYLSYIFRGKELQFEFEVVKSGNLATENTEIAEGI